MGHIIHTSTPNFKSEISINLDKGELISSIDDSGNTHYLDFTLIKKIGQSDVVECSFSIKVDELQEILKYYETYKLDF